jgi:hypothetical protein
MFFVVKSICNIYVATFGGKSIDINTRNFRGKKKLNGMRRPEAYKLVPPR